MAVASTAELSASAPDRALAAAIGVAAGSCSLRGLQVRCSAELTVGRRLATCLECPAHFHLSHAPTLLAYDIQSRIAGQVSASFKCHSTAGQAGLCSACSPSRNALHTCSLRCMAARLSMQGLQWRCFPPFECAQPCVSFIRTIISQGSSLLDQIGDATARREV